MTYSLNTLNGEADRPAMGAVVGRFGQEIGLVLGGMCWAFWALALLTYSDQDAAWSTSGHGEALVNWGGSLGAYLADASYFALGLSVWWLLAVGARMWLGALARWVRSGESVELPEDSPGRMRHPGWFWLALVVLIASSCVLEWTRLHRLDAMVPGQSGGVLGQWLGGHAMAWLGFHGSALVAVCLWGGIISLGSLMRYDVYIVVTVARRGRRPGFTQTRERRSELAVVMSRADCCMSASRSRL